MVLEQHTELEEQTIINNSPVNKLEEQTIINNSQILYKVPKIPHNKCGKMHLIGTPCPSHDLPFVEEKINVENKKQPKTVHNKCGKFHLIGTPCPDKIINPTLNIKKNITKPHNLCGFIHPLKTPCPKKEQNDAWE
jgi:hypothetical protein